MIHVGSPNARIQYYLSWGRPLGDDYQCNTVGDPTFCTYEAMQDRLTESYTTFGCMEKPAQVAPVRL